jgi:hypothetical protein
VNAFGCTAHQTPEHLPVLADFAQFNLSAHPQCSPPNHRPYPLLPDSQGQQQAQQQQQSMPPTSTSAQAAADAAAGHAQQDTHSRDAGSAGSSRASSPTDGYSSRAYSPTGSTGSYYRAPPRAAITALAGYDHFCDSAESSDISRITPLRVQVGCCCYLMALGLRLVSNFGILCVASWLGGGGHETSCSCWTPFKGCIEVCDHFCDSAKLSDIRSAGSHLCEFGKGEGHGSLPPLE